jgi:methyl-accepting chemotaxis protein
MKFVKNCGLRLRLYSLAVLVLAGVASLTGVAMYALSQAKADTGMVMLTGLGVAAILIAYAVFTSHAVTSSILNMAAVMRAVCDNRDLSVRAEAGSGELGAIAKVFNRMLGEFEDMMMAVNSTSSRLYASSERLMSITGQTINGVTRQQVETDQVATAMNEMAATAQEVARNANEAASAAKQANVVGKDGAEKSVNAMCGMDNLVAKVENAADVIQGVSEESKQIGGVLDVIKGIAEQTNLLALNAAIEAARAGEQGRGFAVVADEVRTLASRTQASTEEIHGMIERLQAGTKKAVNVMGEARELGSDGSAQAEAAAEALAEIAGSITIINDMNTQIASAAEEQSAVAEEINQSIVNIVRVAQESSGGAEEISSMGEELIDISQALTAAINNFNNGAGS